MDGEAKGWTVDPDRRVLGLQVVLLKRRYVLPWAQFLYAEGSSEEVHAIFSTHDVVIKGRDLVSLLADFAAQQIAVLEEPSRADRFVAGGGSRITGLEVRRVEPDAEELA